jgi:hypothetical protein
MRPASADLVTTSASRCVVLIERRIVEQGRGAAAYRLVLTLDGSSRQLFNGATSVAPPAFSRPVLALLRVVL